MLITKHELKPWGFFTFKEHSVHMKSVFTDIKEYMQ